MSEDRNNGIGDSAVSDAYRDVATERAPASLNEAVLHSAAAHSSKGYAHSMLWMRPLAYAATVVLSLAIVIQVVLPTNMDPEMAATSSSSAADAAEPVPDADLELLGLGSREQTAEDDDPLKRLRDQEMREESKIEEFVVPAVAEDEAPAVAATAAPTVAAEALPDFSDIEERLDADGLAQRQEVAVPASRQPVADGFAAAAMRSESVIQEAGSMASLRSVQSGDYAESGALAASIERSICEPEDVESPDTWAECIDRMEADGRTDEAIRERALLSEAFPDFEWPAE